MTSMVFLALKKVRESISTLNLDSREPHTCHVWRLLFSKPNLLVLTVMSKVCDNNEEGMLRPKYQGDDTLFQFVY